MVPAPPPVQDIDGAIDEMWVNSTNEIARIDPATENWKTQVLPLARIKKIMKSEEAVYAELERDRQEQQARANGTPVAPNVGPSARFMIAGEAPVLLGKACELLVRELTVRAWRHTERNRRRTLQRQDVHAAVGESEVYDFLIDIVPRIASTTATQKAFGAPGVSVAETPGVGTVPAFGAVHHPGNGPHAPAAPAPPTAQPGDNTAMSLSDAEARYAHLQQVQEQLQDQYMFMQQRVQTDPTSNTAQTATQASAPVGAPQPAGHPAPSQQQQQQQQQTVMMNPTYALPGADPHAPHLSHPPHPGMGQWQSAGAPSNVNYSQPPAHAPAPPAPGT